MEVNSVFFSVARIMQTPVHEGFIQTQTSSIVYSSHHSRN